MVESSVLFCPFCRESFEGERCCPEHELALVTWDRLAPDLAGRDDVLLVEEEQRLQWLHVGHGRGLVAFAAVCLVASFLLDFLRATVVGLDGLPTYKLAVTLPAAWTLPTVALTVMALLARRRSLEGLRSLRVLVPGLGLISVMALGYVLWRLHMGAAVLSTPGRTIGLLPGAGVYAAGVGALLLLVGGARLGTGHR